MGFAVKIFIAIVIAFATSALAFAHGEVSEIQSMPDPVTMIYYTLWISGLAIAASVVFKLNHIEKKIVYVVISVPIIAATVYLAADTVYLNLVSESGGPVHWHADYEVWVCGKKLDLMDPMGFENRIGSPVFHEHNDDRIHVEGVLVRVSDAKLESYFDIIGGKLSESELSYPTDSGTVSAKNGDLCNDKPGKLQAFVYKTTGKSYHQEKVADFPHYVLSPQGQVPPGDCIIIEFGEEKQRTEKMCATYKAAISKGNLSE